METFDNLVEIARGRMNKFPNGNETFQTLARILEEAGEVAKATNHFEDTGSKTQRYGEGDKREIAKESVDLIQNVITLLIHYDLLEEFKDQVNFSVSRLIEQGYLIKSEQK